jgi:hypothetical protein
VIGRGLPTAQAIDRDQLGPRRARDRIERLGAAGQARAVEHDVVLAVTARDAHALDPLDVRAVDPAGARRDRQAGRRQRGIELAHPPKVAAARAPNG